MTLIQRAEFGSQLMVHNHSSTSYQILQEEELFTDMFTFPPAGRPTRLPPLDSVVDSVLDEDCKGP